jgi:regulator of protease activity HflC (stomatin/prohibitin superfamily)
MSSSRAIILLVSSAVVLFFFTVLGGSWYIIDQGEVGVILRNGAVTGTALPGLGFKTPLIDHVVELSTRTERKTYDEVLAYSRDIQPAALKITVNYRMNPALAEHVYADYLSLDGAVDRIITPQIMAKTKVVFGKFTARAAIEERARLGTEMTHAVQEGLGDTGVIIEGLQIENLDFSDAFEQSVEQRMLAEVEVAKLEQNLAREIVQADIVRTQANGQADAKKAQAEAEAYSTRIRGDAEASSIDARGKALRDNPQLVSLITAEKWNGTLPTTMLPGSVVPFVSVK